MYVTTNHHQTDCNQLSPDITFKIFKNINCQYLATLEPKEDWRDYGSNRLFVYLFVGKSNYVQTYTDTNADTDR